MGKGGDWEHDLKYATDHERLHRSSESIRTGKAYKKSKFFLHKKLRRRKKTKSLREHNVKFPRTITEPIFLQINLSVSAVHYCWCSLHICSQAEHLFPGKSECFYFLNLFKDSFNREENWEREFRKCKEEHFLPKAYAPVAFVPPTVHTIWHSEMAELHILTLTPKSGNE